MRRAIAILLLLWPISNTQALVCAVRCALPPANHAAGSMSDRGSSERPRAERASVAGRRSRAAAATNGSGVQNSGGPAACPGMNMSTSDRAPAPKNLPCPRQVHACAHYHAAIRAEPSAVDLASFAVLPGLTVSSAPSGLADFGSRAFAAPPAPDPSPHRFHFRV